MHAARTALATLAVPLTFGLALAGTLGSLYAQHLGFEPCVLCWWQRIFLYPMVVLIPIGILRRDRALPTYILALAVLGALVALYHTLLYFGIVPEALAPCGIGVPCTLTLPTFFGLNLITGSLGTFILISILMLLAQKSYGTK